jgi:hypothetical protein
VSAVKATAIWGQFTSTACPTAPRHHNPLSACGTRPWPPGGRRGMRRGRYRSPKYQKNVHTFNTLAKSQISKVKLFLDAHSTIHIQEHVVRVSSIFMMGPALLVPATDDKQSTPFGDTLLSQSRLHAPPLPPADRIHCQHVSHVPGREEGPGSRS